MKTSRYRLKEFLKIKNGRDHSKLDEGSYPVIGSGGVMRYANQFLYNGESVLLPRKGTLNNIQYINDAFWTVDTCYYTEINKDIAYPYYLYRHLRSLDLSALDSGASIPSMTSKCYYGIKIDLPDLPTQKRIADILSTYDDLIENNNRRIALLEKAAQELYKEWFVRFRFPGYETTEFENGYPAKWKVEKVKSIVKRLPFGRLYKEADVSKEGNVIVIDQSKEACIGFHNDDPSHIATIERPIILFGDHSCKFELMITPFSLSENVVPFVGTENVDSAYLYFLVKDLIETTEYKRHWTELMSKKVLLADNDTQKEFTKVIKSNLLLIESLKVQNRNLTKQRDLLLPRLMSGKLEV